MNTYNRFFDNLEDAWRDYLAGYLVWLLVGVLLPVKLTAWLSLGAWGWVLGIALFCLAGTTAAKVIVRKPDSIGSVVLLLITGFTVMVAFVVFYPLAWVIGGEWKVK